MADYIYTYKDGAFGPNKAAALFNLRRTYEEEYSKDALLDLIFDPQFFTLTKGNYKRIGN